MNDRPEKKLNSRKQNRLESKTKKAAAFLNLVRSNQADKEDTSNKMDTDLIQDSNSMNTKDEDSEDVLKEMQKIVRERKKRAMQKPVVYLTLEDMVPYHPVDVPLPKSMIPPLYVMDLQQLLLYAAQGNVSSFKPRFCKLLRPGKVSSVVVILIDGIGVSDYAEYKECFPYISENFSSNCEVVCPLQYNRTVEKELHSVPLSISQLKKVNVKVPDHIKVKVAEKLGKGTVKEKEKCEKEYKKKSEESGKKSEKKPETTGMSRKCLLLSTRQMMLEGYPLPIVNSTGNFRNFVFSKAEYKKVTESSPLLALDCEMCLTTAHTNELTRVSIVTEAGELIYDKLVKPYNPIINYLTKYSGITKQMLDPVTTRIEDVQRDIRELLPPDAIICGQSLNSDLIALKLFHPYVIDTSVIFNMSGKRGVKAGLRKLTQFFLGRVIQDNSDGHCSHEDAEAALDLVKLKLTKGLEFGDATLAGIYFPDVKTYFLGEENGTKKTENIEVTSKPSQSLTETGDNQSNVEKDEKRMIESKKAAVENDNSTETSDEDESKSSEPPRKKVKKDKDPKMETQDKFFDAASTSDLLDQQTSFLFSQDNSVHINQSFFRLVYEAGRPGCVIDREAVTKNFLKEPIEIITVEDDSIAQKTAKEKVKSNEFLWLKYHDIADAREEDVDKAKMMRKVDKRVKSVLKRAKEHCVVMVIMTGQKDETQLQNMMTFIKVT